MSGKADRNPEKANKNIRLSSDFNSPINLDINQIPAVTIISRLSDGMIMDVNNNFEHESGYSKSDVLGKTSTELNLYKNPPDRDMIISSIRSSGKVDNLPIEFKTKDRSIRTGMFSASLINHEGTDYLLIILRDVTEFLSVKENLQESEERYHDLLNSIPIGIYKTNPEGKFIQANNALLKLLGFSNKYALKNYNVKDFYVDPDSRKQNLQELDEKGLCTSTLLLKKKNGEHFWALDYSKAVKDEKGRVISYDGALRDISERVKSRKAEAAEREKFEKLTKYLKSAVYTFDHEGFFDYTNIAMQEITAYSHEELKKMHFWDLIHPEHRKKVKDRGLQRLAGDNIEGSYEFRIIRKDGRVRWIEISNAKIELADKPIVLGTANDITEQKYANLIRDVVFNITSAVISSADQADIYLIVKHELGKLIDTTNFYIVFYDESRGLINLPFMVDKKDDFNTFPAGRTLTSHVIKSKKPQLLTKEEIKQLKSKSKIEIVGSMSEVWMGAPMIVENETIGLIGVQSYEDKNAFNKEDLKILEFVSNQLAILFARRRAEQQLKESEKKFRLLAENNPGIIYQCKFDDQFTMTYLNEQIEQLTGYQKEEFLVNKKSFAGLIHPNDIEEVYQRIQESISDKKPFIIRYRFKCKNGQYRWFHEIGIGVFKNEKFLYLQGIINDITEQTKVQIALEESEERNRALSQAAREAIVFSVKGEIIETNLAACEMFGYTYNELIGKHASQLVAPESKDLLKKNIAENYLEAYEAVAIRKDGTKFPVEFHGQHYTYKGRNIRVTVCRDISKAKADEKVILQQNKDLIRAIKKAEESDKLKSAFLANMSHEIRTPLNGILGFAELLRYAENKIDVEEYIDVINRSGNQLLNIINDIIDISKIEAGQLTINLRETNLVHLLDNVANIYQKILKRKNSQVKLEVSKPDQDLRIITDEKRVHQVLSNLIDNAIKFTRKGNIKISLSVTDDKKTLFEVKDSGIGIEKAKQKMIFERFRQLDETSTREFGGTGLGLSICRSIIEKLGGRIWVESEFGRGSSFFFDLPLIIQRKEDLRKNDGVKKKTSAKPDLKDKSILIVEDDESNFMFLKTALRKTGINILVARNGKEAINMYNNNKNIGLILMDIQLPVLNGIDATKEIRKTDREVPIIAQTAYAMSDDRKKCLDAGCNDYIPKPIKMDILMNKLNKYLK
ncbi:MAG: PAS domain S-box protein [Bacteroidales bacterium]|nr:PAS domain S-box protein [Bacteroidales bacterium]MCF8399187.1 PAS domain S-box protein [Bacteroidales bacterium]